MLVNSNAKKRYIEGLFEVVPICYDNHKLTPDKYSNGKYYGKVQIYVYPKGQSKKIAHSFEGGEGSEFGNMAFYQGAKYAISVNTYRNARRTRKVDMFGYDNIVATLTFNNLNARERYARKKAGLPSKPEHIFEMYDAFRCTLIKCIAEHFKNDPYGVIPTIASNSHKGIELWFTLEHTVINDVTTAAVDNIKEYIYDQLNLMLENNGLRKRCTVNKKKLYARNQVATLPLDYVVFSHNRIPVVETGNNVRKTLIHKNVEKKLLRAIIADDYDDYYYKEFFNSNRVVMMDKLRELRDGFFENSKDFIFVIACAVAKMNMDRKKEIEFLFKMNELLAHPISGKNVMSCFWSAHKKPYKHKNDKLVKMFKISKEERYAIGLLSTEDKIKSQKEKEAKAYLKGAIMRITERTCINLYNQGKTIEGIMKITKLSRATVYRRLHQTISNERNSRRIERLIDVFKAVLAYNQEGKPIDRRSLAEKHNCTFQTICNDMKKCDKIYYNLLKNVMGEKTKEKEAITGKGELLKTNACVKPEIDELLQVNLTADYIYGIFKRSISHKKSVKSSPSIIKPSNKEKVVPLVQPVSSDFLKLVG